MLLVIPVLELSLVPSGHSTNICWICKVNKCFVEYMMLESTVIFKINFYWNIGAL